MAPPVQGSTAGFARSATSRQYLRLPALLAAALVLLAVIVLFWFNPARYEFYPTCALYRTTGLLCPGCGSLRALHHLLHGHLVTAFHFNAFLIGSIPIAGWLALRIAVLKARRQSAGVAVRPLWLWLALAAVVAFGVLRNLPFPQFAWLRP